MSGRENRNPPQPDSIIDMEEVSLCALEKLMNKGSDLEPEKGIKKSILPSPTDLNLNPKPQLFLLLQFQAFEDIFSLKYYSPPPMALSQQIVPWVLLSRPPLMPHFSCDICPTSLISSWRQEP
ncbi:hypothetical protein P7K49_024364 [Saguinus oedipus]|uniref:Uncharacterized protein n=1 Tax=Saguinus oedipus TaxID=9490 RepID=A0ABQ9UPC0_SAGOE|nr:hypothetical protein P7K49_024364 [Saguinus oedipus]